MQSRLYKVARKWRAEERRVPRVKATLENYLAHPCRRTQQVRSRLIYPKEKETPVHIKTYTGHSQQLYLYPPQTRVSADVLEPQYILLTSQSKTSTDV